MSVHENWVMSVCYLCLSLLYAVGCFLILLLALVRSIGWFLCLPFKAIAAGWRAVRGG